MLMVGGIAIGVGVEIGRTFQVTAVQLLSKKFREDVKTEYHRRMKVIKDEPVTYDDWARWSKTLNSQDNKPGEKA